MIVDRRITQTAKSYYTNSKNGGFGPSFITKMKLVRYIQENKTKNHEKNH